MEDGQYTRAMRLITDLLLRRPKVSRDEILERNRKERIPEQVVLGLLDYLESRKCVSKFSTPDHLVRYSVLDRDALRLNTPHTRRRASGLVLTLPAFNRYGIHYKLWALGIDYTSTESAFRGLLSSAEREVLICSPFAEIDGLKRFSGVLGSKLRSGCKVTLLSRQVAKSDRNSRYGQMTEFVGLLAADGAPPGSLEVRNYHFSDARRVESSSHAKFIVVDGERAYVGSADVRPNSLDRNFEVGILIKGSSAAELRRVFLTMLAEADTIAGGN